MSDELKTAYKVSGLAISLSVLMALIEALILFVL